MKECTPAFHIYSRHPEYGELCKCGKFPWSIPEIEQRNLSRKRMIQNVVSLKQFKEKKKVNVEVSEYKEKLIKMDKLELLEEMVRYQEWRSKEGKLSIEMIVKGLILFPLLSKSAETKELRLLTGSYTKHLEYELAQLQQSKPLPPGA